MQGWWWWEVQSIVSSTSAARFLILRNDVTLLAFTVLRLRRSAGDEGLATMETELKATLAVLGCAQNVMSTTFSLSIIHAGVLHRRVLNVPSDLPSSRSCGVHMLTHSNFPPPPSPPPAPRAIYLKMEETRLPRLARHQAAAVSGVGVVRPGFG